MEIRSFRRVFDLERRVYRIDRLRLNPGGVPVRGVVYFLALLLTVLIAGRLPLLSALSRVLPWYLRDLALPTASAAVLTMIRVEGRPFHLAVGAMARHRAGPRQLAGVRACAALGERWHPPDILLLPDGSGSRMRRMRYTGPGAVLVAVAHDRADPMSARRFVSVRAPGSPALILRELPERRTLDEGQVIELAPGARLLVRSGAGRERGDR
jgi:hypothetical protein